ncbi:MAG: MFS transporter, partial [Actinobacteria bacterium]|nr:MFS transporter [Actinomycetota bacterium]
IDDVVDRRPGWLASMVPQVGVPPAARSLFAASAPSLVATWALGGLYLSLGPTLAISLLGSESHIAGGLVIVALTGSGAIVSVLAHSVEPRLLVARASLALLVGIAITLAAVATSSTALLYAGSVVAGAGFGPAFSGIFRSLAPLAPPEGRSGLIASIYVVSYLAFSVPAVIAGVALTDYDLADTTYVYGAVLIVLAGFTAFAVGRDSGHTSPAAGIGSEATGGPQSTP